MQYKNITTSLKLLPANNSTLKGAVYAHMTLSLHGYLQFKCMSHSTIFIYGLPPHDIKIDQVQLDQIIIIYISAYGIYNVYMCTKVHPEGLYIHRYILINVTKSN